MRPGDVVLLNFPYSDLSEPEKGSLLFSAVTYGDSGRT